MEVVTRINNYVRILETKGQKHPPACSLNAKETGSNPANIPMSEEQRPGPLIGTGRWVLMFPCGQYARQAGLDFLLYDIRLVHYHLIIT